LTTDLIHKNLAIARLLTHCWYM